MTWKEFIDLNKYVYRYRWRFLLGIVFIVVSNVFGIYTPQVVRHALDAVVDTLNKTSNGHISNFSHQAILFASLLFGLAVARGIFMFMMRQSIITMSRLIEFDQKNEIYSHYQALDTAFYKQHNTGDLMNRITEDVSRVRNYFGPGLMYTINLLSLFIMVIITMIKVNPTLTFYSLLPLPVLCFTIFYVNIIIQKRSERIQAKLSDLTTTAQESYAGIRVVKAFAVEKQMRRFFNIESDDYRALNLHLVGLESIYFPIIMILVGISTLLTVWMGGRQVIAGTLTIGNIAEFLMYIQMLTWPMAAVGWVMALVQRAFVSQHRINDFLHQAPSIHNPSQLNTIIKGAIAFNKVTFTYPHTGITALKNVSFKIEPGQKLMVVGRTGSGKSSLAQLMLRQYDVTEGSISIDGTDIKRLNLDALRRQTGYVSQDVFLFSDTVFNNIKFGKQNATQDEVVHAAKMSAVDNEIMHLENGYSTIIGERGVTLSGGQKQRLSIARALIKKPQVIILDDCLSAVDTATERHILENFTTQLANCTTILITHRIFTTIAFDSIIVLDDGEIIEQGTHDELMHLQGYYYEMFTAQTSAYTAEDAIIMP